MISEIVLESLYEKVGLQNGDIISKVNSAEVTGLKQAMAMFQKWQHATFIDVKFQWLENMQHMHYDIQ